MIGDFIELSTSSKLNDDFILKLRNCQIEAKPIESRETIKIGCIELGGRNASTIRAIKKDPICVYQYQKLADPLTLQPARCYGIN
ncbi:MAG: hypothetical protein VXX36_08220 [Verrucomicrobiota bacterium]|nr:hypothetical protein [Verrucomicrobiota bacterium]